MAVGGEVRKSYSSDTDRSIASVQCRQISAADAEVPASWITEKKATTALATHRTISAVDTGDISSYSGALDCGNSAHVTVFAEHTVASASADMIVALYAQDGTFMGVSDPIPLLFDSTFRNGGSGPYPAPGYVVELRGASHAKVWCRSMTAGTITVKLSVL